MNNAFRKYSKNQLALAITATIAISSTAFASAESDLKTVELSIQQGTLKSALMDLGESAGVNVVFSGEISDDLGFTGLKGDYSFSQALEILLKGTGFTYEFTDNDAVLIKDNETKEEDNKPSEEFEEIVVTGSRIARNSSQLAANTITLTAEDLKATGSNTLEGALRQLPQNINGASEVGAVMNDSGMSFNGAVNITGGSSIDLRGLGGESTLVLIDGRRIGKSGVFGGVSDISAIPLNSVERVEILLDGASAIYGSDAIGGVVNIILKKDYEGAEVTYEYGKPQEGGFSEHVLTISGGTHWDGGQIRATLERFQRNNLDGRERPERIFQTIYRSPGLVEGFPLFYEYNGENYNASDLAGLGLTPTSPGVTRIFYAPLPEGQDGTSALPPSAFDGITFTDSFDPDAGDGISLIPDQERTTLQLGFDQMLPGKVRLSGSAYYSDRQTHAANGSFTFTSTFHEADHLLPNNSSFFPITSLYWRVPGLADKHYETDQQVTRWHLALDGDIGDDWRWQTTVNQSRDEITSYYYNNPIHAWYYSDDMLAFLGGEPFVDDYRFTELVEAGLNIFASDIVGANDPALLAQLVESREAIFAVNKENNFEASANGALFALPGGDAHLSVGASWRQEILESRSERGLTQDSFRNNVSAPNRAFDSEVSQTVRSGFAEVLLPLVGADNTMAGVDQLDLTGAARYDSYSSFGSDSTWSLGLIWSPVEQLRVKLNKSTSYVVPTPRDALIPTESFSYNGTWTQPIRDENGNETGMSEQIGRITFGGNPDLEPETAQTLTAGLEFTPEVIPGLTLSAVWHQTHYSNRIAPAPNPEFILGTDYVSKYPNISRDPDTGFIDWDQRASNNLSVDVQGVDYRLHYNRDTDVGQFTVIANVAYTGKYDRVELAGDPPINEVADVDFQSRRVIPAYRYSANFGWHYGGLSLNLDASTASKTTSTGAHVTTGLIQRVNKPALNTDFLLSYDFDQSGLTSLPEWLSGTAFSFKVLNILDDHPEYQVNNLTTGESDIPELNANLADPRGRMFYLGVTKRF